MDNKENGFIYPAFQKLYRFIDEFNLVERCKEKFKDKSSREIVDIYIIIKWFILILAISIATCDFWVNYIFFIIVLYLVFYNIFTYIKYHIIIKSDKNDSLTLQRRILLVIQSFSFIIMYYTYLYLFFKEEFVWPFFEFCSQKIFIAFLFSGANSFISTNINPLNTHTLFGQFIVLSQIGLTYIYISVLIINSISKLKN